MNKLSLFEKLSLTLSIVGTISLIFVVVQIRQTSQSLRASAFATVANYTMELDKVFIDDPDLRPYFYNGRDTNELDDKYNQVMATAEFELDFFDATLTQLELRPGESKSEMRAEEMVWRKYIQDSFAKSPALCERIKSNPDWYRENLNDLARQSCGQVSTK
jgi:hypothetical protein